MGNDQSKFARRDECDLQHETIDTRLKGIESDVSYIRGKIDGMADQKGNDITFYGMLSALALAIFNFVK